MTLLHKKLIHSAITMGFATALFFLFFTSETFAQTTGYTPLVGIPNVPKGSTSIPTYINAVYLLTIGLGALIGVLRIAWSGVKYSLSDIVTDKAGAKHDIQGVLLGLAILLIPFIVLKTINPELVNLNVFRGASAVRVNLNVPSTVGGVPNNNVNAQTLGNVPAPSQANLPAGTEVRNCPLTEMRKVFVPGKTTEGGYDTIYDDTSCKNKCAGWNGVFIIVQPWYASCTFNPKPGTVVSPDQVPDTPFNVGA